MTEIQIIYTLISRPHTFEEIREETNIQRNALKSILQSFLKNNILTSHRLSVNIKTLTDIEDINPGSIYYIINLDSIEMQRIVLDPTPRYLRQIVSKSPKIFPDNMKAIIINKLKSLPIIHVNNFYQKELIKEVQEEVRISFLGLIDQEYENETSRQVEEFSKTKDAKDFIKESKKALDNIKFNQNLMIIQAKSFVNKSLKSFLDRGLSKWDFLIYLTGLKETRKLPNIDQLYMAFHKALKDYDSDNKEFKV